MYYINTQLARVDWFYGFISEFEFYKRKLYQKFNEVKSSEALLEILLLYIHIFIAKYQNISSFIKKIKTTLEEETNINVDIHYTESQRIFYKWDIKEFTM